MNQFFDLAQWSLVVGFFFPILVAIVKQQGFSRTVNSVIAVVLAAIAGWVTAATNGDVSWDTWAASAIAVYTAAVAAYNGLWSNLGEERLQAATSVVKAKTYE